ncbi:hypothetical protein GCM10007884_51590 [Methylobacterium brachythecii]|uniref:STAS domain-containing protein n=1 Tax=Methylobacterium brachythecii TaxID=1176177 RepID=A0ABQ6DB03_9HYPH|nr:hypothetical protein GCM10007884_51590 [Methylobacterium brachythecii]
MLVQANHETKDLASFLTNDLEFVNDLVSVVSLNYEDAALDSMTILGLLSLCQDRSHQTTVLTTLTSGIVQVLCRR